MHRLQKYKNGGEVSALAFFLQPIGLDNIDLIYSGLNHPNNSSIPQESKSGQEKKVSICRIFRTFPTPD